METSIHEEILKKKVLKIFMCLKLIIILYFFFNTLVNLNKNYDENYNAILKINK